MAITTEQVAHGVHRVVDGLVNWYLLEEDGRVSIVDTGWPRSSGRIEEALGKIGHSTTDVEAILLTHGHPDHMGGAERARTLTGAPVRAHRDEVARTKGTAKGSSPLGLVPSLVPQLRRPAAVKFVAQATLQGFLTPTWVEEVEPFDSGDELDVPGRPVAVPTPGHTEGHVSFHLPRLGVIITGDELATYDPITGSRGPRMVHDVVNADPPRVRSSLANLEGLTGDTLLPGHGEPWTGTMAEAVARAREADAA